MKNTLIFLWIFVPISFFIITILIFLLKSKRSQIQQLKNTIIKLQKSFDNLDEQAKLIVKTDLELNKAQEELDRRLDGLDSLQKTSRLISTTLEEKEIFQRLNHALLTELGFEKNLIFIKKENDLTPLINHGFNNEQLQNILNQLKENTSLITSLKEGKPLCSINISLPAKENIIKLFQTQHFILAPIIIKEGFLGLIFVGNPSNAAPITQGDAELISILATQIGQSLENAKLFEEVFHSSQMLEVKVQERTKQLKEVLDEVQQISKTKSDFISAVSHELRTPLTSIKGYASILMAGKLGEIPEPVKQRLGKINTHSDNLVALINDLLDISRIESGRVEMNIRPCNIINIIENIHDLLTPQMKEKNIHWNVEIAQNTPNEILIDTQQVERIFINLVGNAIKFTPENGTISVKTTAENQTLTIEISDTGIGITKEDIARLFDEFYRVENNINQNVKGTGLGLPLAKKIIEAHQGTIWITSELNQGTTFHFTLPFSHKINDINKELST